MGFKCLYSVSIPMTKAFVDIHNNCNCKYSSCDMLMARGAVISMLLVIFILPAMLMLLDKLIYKTTIGMTKINTNNFEVIR